LTNAIRMLRVRPDRMQQILPAAVLTPAEVAELLKLSKNTVYERLKDGSIPAIKIKGSWRIPSRRLMAWLEGTE